MTSELTPFDDDVALLGETAPKLTDIEDWIRYLLTVRKRWGNTITLGRFKLTWGGNALWLADDMRKLLQRWYEADCPDMTCGTDGWTCELCTETKKMLGIEDKE